MPLVLWVLGAQTGQVGLVALQSPRVKAPPLGLVPFSVFHECGDWGIEMELGPQERRGRAVGEGSTRQSEQPWLAAVARGLGEGARPSDRTLLGWALMGTAPGCSPRCLQGLRVPLLPHSGLGHQIGPHCSPGRASLQTPEEFIRAWRFLRGLRWFKFMCK